MGAALEDDAAYWVVYLTAVSTSAVPLVAVLAAFSQMSPWSASFVGRLLSVPPSVGICLACADLLGISSLLLVRDKVPVCSYWTAWWVLLILGEAAAVLLTPQHPCMTMPGLIVTGPVVLFSQRKLLFKDVPSSVWCRVQLVSSGSSAAASLLAWSAWIFVGFPGRSRWFDWTEPFSAMVVEGKITWKLAFVLWAGPLGCSAVLGLIAVVYWVRLHYLRLHSKDDQDAFIADSVKQLLGWLVVGAMLVWIGASISATEEREDMRDETIYMAFGLFICLGLWLMRTYGNDAFAGMVGQSKSKAASEAQSILNNDWVKACLLLVAVVPFLLYWLVYCSVSRLWPQNKPWPLIEIWSHWQWTSVNVKAIWLGVIYVFFVATFGKITIVLLAMTNEAISDWPVISVSIIMFLIGFVTFMFPSSPAAPVYVLMGLVIVNSAHLRGWSFEAGLAWATFVTFAMKLAFTAAAQKWIGEPLGKQPWVQRAIGIHTPYMRAVEDILKEPLSVAKTAILIGGPDWPVAVLCGVLGLPLLPTLACVSPVLVQSVFPCVLSGALLYFQHGHRDHADRAGGSSPALEVSGLAEVSLLVAGALQFATGIVAFVCVQEVLERDYDRLSTLRPQDAWLKELDDREEARSRCLHRLTCWEDLPWALRLALTFGLVFVEWSLMLLTGPWHDIWGVACFRNFDLTSSVEEDLGGNPWAIVQPLGWVALGLAGLAAGSLGYYYAFVAGLKVDVEDDEGVALRRNLTESPTKMYVTT
mmetsp:Transcript_20048/g.50024  ORF Transcript_20048/g.50024 Transcript_20048/m.50024 type:complete len:756 (-) Transcript_20048:51-2318(-)